MMRPKMLKQVEGACMCTEYDYTWDRIVEFRNHAPIERTQCYIQDRKHEATKVLNMIVLYLYMHLHYNFQRIPHLVINNLSNPKHKNV